MKGKREGGREEGRREGSINQQRIHTYTFRRLNKMNSNIKESTSIVT
jgi:hypothetical protein